MFNRTIGIDYSGAETAEASLKGLRVYQTIGDEPAHEVLPPPGPKKYWTRAGLAAWLIQELDGSLPSIIGVDHAFSFPMRYFERHGLEPDWDRFLEDFCAHWPTDRPHTYVDFVRNGSVGNGAARSGERRWRRVTEEATGSAKSVFHFDVQGSVAKSTHSGIPWLRRIRTARPKVHFWPFDGWTPAVGASVISEVYPRLWSPSYPVEDRTQDQHDACSIARWLQEADQAGTLPDTLAAPEPDQIAAIGRVEGWILGSCWPPSKPSRPGKRTRGRGTVKTAPSGLDDRDTRDGARRTDVPGNGDGHVVHILACERCGKRYGANGSDLSRRLCPTCSGRRPGGALSGADRGK